jgi:hypothetical protein
MRETTVSAVWQPLGLERTRCKAPRLYAGSACRDSEALVAVVSLCCMFSDSARKSTSAKTVACLVSSCFALELVDESLDLSLRQATDAIEAHPTEGQVQLLIKNNVA